MICSICKFQGQFTIFRKENRWHVKNTWCCPRCLSKNQHRLMWLVYQKLQNEIIGKKILHCSPNRALKEKFSKDFDYLSIDFPPREGLSGIAKAGLNQDLRDTCFKNEYFDIIVCSHVLDQIEEDEKAIKEIHRILKPNGIALIVVPIYPEEKTKKLLEPILNHWWRCGYDYFNKLRKAKFSVEVIKYDYFENWEELGLDGAVLALCRKKRKTKRGG